MTRYNKTLQWQNDKFIFKNKNLQRREREDHQWNTITPRALSRHFGEQTDSLEGRKLSIIE